MINSGVGAVRRHPRPRGAHAGDAGGELPQPDRPRRAASGDRSGSSRRARTTTRTSTRRSDDPAAAKELSDAYCADFPENCTDGKINMELQFPAGSVVLDQTGDLLIQGWGDSFNVEIQTIPQDEHIQEAALGQYNAVMWRQFGAEDPALDNVWLLCRTVGGISLNWPKSCDPCP